MKRLTAIVVGLVLFALPFAAYGTGSGHGHAGPHADHGPRHGGQLIMVGDFHLEMLESEETVELYLSDAFRRPLRPLSATAAFDDERVQRFRWRGYRLVAEKPEGAETISCEVTAREGLRLPARFVLGAR